MERKVDPALVQVAMVFIRLQLGVVYGKFLSCMDLDPHAKACKPGSSKHDVVFNFGQNP